MTQFTTSGITADTYDLILQKLIDGFKKIYGSDIILTSDTPDGQRVALFAELLSTESQILAKIYNSLNPSNATGAALDNIAAIQGVSRILGKKSTVDIDISTNKDTTIPLNFELVDQQGNSWLATTATSIKAGTTETIRFESALSGSYPVNASAIWQQANILDGITSIINGAASTVGSASETDASFRKRLQSVIVNGIEKGNLSDMYKALESLKNNSGGSAFTHIKLVENNSDANLSTGQTPHSVRIILRKNGTVDDAAIAKVIADSKPAGVNTWAKTPTNIEVTEHLNVLGQTLDVKYSYVIDSVAQQDLTIALDLQPIGTPTLGFDEIKQFLIDNLIFQVGVGVTRSEIEALLYPFIQGQYTINTTTLSHNTVSSPEILLNLNKNNITIS